jgi:hypothetical protein
MLDRNKNNNLPHSFSSFTFMLADASLSSTAPVVFKMKILKFYLETKNCLISCDLRMSALRSCDSAIGSTFFLLIE